MNKYLTCALVLYLLTANAVCSELTHTFINPNFGGNPFNGTPLLNSAQVQNNHKEKEADEVDEFESSNLERFRERLNSIILSRLSEKIVDELFGDDEGIQPGTYTTGDFTVEISEDLGGINVNIQDIETGDQTTVNVPFF